MHNSISRKEAIKVSSIAFIIAMISIMWMIQPAFSFARAGYITLLGLIICTVIARYTNFNNFVISNLFKDPIFYFILLLGISYIASSLIYSDRDRLVMGITIGLIMPICSSILNRDFEKKIFLCGFTIGNVIAFFFLFFASLFFAPKIYTGQYYSILLNPNGLSTALLPMLISSLYLLEINRKKGKKIKVVLHLIILSFIVSFLILSMSRTGLLSFVGVLLIYLLYLLINTRNKMYTLKMVFIIMFLSYLAFSISSLAVTNFSVNILKYRAMNTNKVYVFNQENSGYLDSKEVLNSIKCKKYKSVESSLEGDLEKRLSKGSRTGEDVSSGRVSIWKASIDQLNFKGHSRYDYFYVPERDINTNDTHNIYLDMGYFLGIPSIIFMIVIMVFNIYRSLNSFIKGWDTKYVSESQLLTTFVVTAFFILSMLASVYNPIGTIIGMIFWIISCWKSI